MERFEDPAERQVSRLLGLSYDRGVAELTLPFRLDSVRNWVLPVVFRRTIKASTPEALPENHPLIFPTSEASDTTRPPFRLLHSPKTLYNN